MTDVALAIKMSADAGDAAAAADQAGDAFTRMADDVDAAASKADAAGGRLGSVADSADNLGSSTSQAAGGLGDLGGALSAVPGPLGAVGSGMESLAPLVMGVTGATDLLTLASNSKIVTTIRDTATTAAHAVVTKTAAAASKVMAAGQWALNAALAANPVGLVVIAVAALVAGFILAYNKSETFRNIVDGAMKGAKAAVQLVVDKVDNITDAVGDVIDKIPGMSGAIGAAKTLVVGYFDAMTLPIRTIIGLVEDLIGWIKKIDFPDLPHIPGTRSSTGSTGSGSRGDTLAALGLDARGGAAGPANLVQITVQGAVDPTSTARQIAQLLRRAGISVTGQV